MEIQENDSENQSGDAGNPSGNLGITVEMAKKIAMDMINSKSGEKSK